MSVDVALAGRVAEWKVLMARQLNARDRFCIQDLYQRKSPLGRVRELHPRIIRHNLSIFRTNVPTVTCSQAMREYLRVLV